MKYLKYNKNDFGSCSYMIWDSETMCSKNVYQLLFHLDKAIKQPYQDKYFNFIHNTAFRFKREINNLRFSGSLMILLNK